MGAEGVAGVVEATVLVLIFVPVPFAVVIVALVVVAVLLVGIVVVGMEVVARLESEAVSEKPAWAEEAREGM